MDNPFKSPKIISYCPGILGLERGLERAIGKLNIVTYVEIEAFIITNLIAGMEAGILDPAPIWTDAKTFDARPFRGRIHGIIGGYPCPGESLAGLREGHLYKGFIWPNIRKAIAAARPLWCFFENVDDHLTGTYPIVQRSLHNMGYRVEADVYTAEEVGAPHERKRLFILAIASRELQHRGRDERGRWDEYTNGSQELANGNCYGYGAGTGQIIGTGGQIESKAQRQEWCDLLGQWMRDVIGNGRKELDDTEIFKRGLQLQSGGSFKSHTESIGSGKEMANTEGITERKQADATDTESESGFPRQESGQRCDQLADLNGQGLEIGREQSAWQKQPTPERSHFNHWPSRPGQQQYEWEEPRTTGYVNRLPGSLRSMWNKSRKDFAKILGEKIWSETDARLKAYFESSLGSAINGYNFREDILRALGNSVVEDTAEVAFIDLMKKHLKNL